MPRKPPPSELAERENAAPDVFAAEALGLIWRIDPRSFGAVELQILLLFSQNHREGR